MTNQMVYRSSAMSSAPSGSAVESSPVSMQAILHFLRMRWMTIVATTLVAGALGFLYVATATPSYSTSTLLLLNRQTSGTDVQALEVQASFIEGQLEIANSFDTLASVVKKLDLGSKPEFQEEAPSLISRLREQVAPPPAGSSAEPAANPFQTDEEIHVNALVTALRGHVTLRQIGQSAVIEITASSSDPYQAMQIANALADEYIAKNISMKSSGARTYSEWLGRFVTDQQRELVDAANALSQFRATGDPRDQFKLTELQSAAEARKTLYETTLTRFTEARQQISYPVSDATVISKAGLPLSKSHPRRGLVMAFTVLVGLLAGLMLAFGRHATDRRITQAGRLGAEAGLPFVAKLSSSKSRLSGRKTPVALFSEESQQSGSSLSRDVAELGASLAVVRHVKRSPIIGIVGVEPDVGATTTAFGLARQWADTGIRVLLLDASDETTLSRLLAPDADFGISDVLDAAESFESTVVWLTPNFAFVPFGSRTGATPAARVSSKRTGLRLQDLKEKFDAVLIDLPAVSASADARLIASSLDGVVVVSRYRRTSVDLAVETVRQLRSSGADVLGGVVNFATKA